MVRCRFGAEILQFRQLSFLDDSSRLIKENSTDVSQLSLPGIVLGKLKVARFS